MLLRTDPSHHRLAYLSIPRDLRVRYPGLRRAEDQRGDADRRAGARDARRSRTSPASAINHVMFVDFARVQGPDRQHRRHRRQRPRADPLEPVRLPVRREPLPDVEGLAVRQGRAAHGRPAGAGLLAHPREPAQPGRHGHHARRAPAGRAPRATLRKLLGAGTFFELPFNGGKLLEPLTTDLSAWQFVQLGWVLKRAADGQARCTAGSAGRRRLRRLGDIIPSEENLAVIQMVTGAPRVQPPRPGSGRSGPAASSAARPSR